jgi:putative ABC transport system substrate-binding protein
MAAACSQRRRLRQHSSAAHRSSAQQGVARLFAVRTGGVRWASLALQGFAGAAALQRPVSEKLRGGALTAGAGALFVLSDPLTHAQRKQIVAFSATHRLPALYGAWAFVRDGGLMSYAVDYRDLFRRAATYVDKLLQGTKPAGLSVQQPTKFKLGINLKTANAISLTIPPTLLFQADEVIR